MAAGYLVSQMIMWLFVKKYITFVIPSVSNIIKHIKPNVTLFLPVIATSIYKIMDKIMLGSMTNMSQVGYYENAEKIVNVPIALITAVGAVMLPRMTSLIARRKFEESKGYIDKSMMLAIGFSVGAAFGVYLFGKEFSILYYGREFELSGLIMKYLAISIIFLAIGNVVRTQFLIPNRMDKVYVISAIVGAGVNVVINIIAIRVWGAVGAALGTVAAELVVCSFQFWHVRISIKISDYFSDIFFFISWWDFDGDGILVDAVGCLIILLPIYKNTIMYDYLYCLFCVLHVEN